MNTVVLPTSLIVPDGSRAVRVESFEDRQHVFDRDALGLAYRMQLSPGAHHSRVIVVLDPLLETEVAAWGFKSLSSAKPEEAVVHIGLAAVARHLATLPPGGEEGLRRAECWTECLKGLAQQTRASDDQILHYLKAKLYWAWKYDLSIIRLEWFDTLLLGAPFEVVDRVSLIADGEFLKRTLHTSGAITYEPSRKLLKQFPLLLAPATAAGTAVADLLQRLSVPRYAGPRLHMEKAIQFMTAEPQDAANGAKEAICAVEGLARIVAGDPTPTLGDLIARFKAQGKLNPALAKALEGLWGFASNSPGVRHGATSGVTITPEEADFVIGSSRAAIGLLLALDTP